MNALYTAVAHATGDGRNGHATTDDGILDLELRTPKELGGAGGATNPEQLFAAGFAACFHSALKLTAKGAGLDPEGSEVSATVQLGMLAGGGLGLAVELDVHVPNIAEAAARDLVEQTEKVCPYSNAVRGNVEVKLSLV